MGKKLVITEKPSVARDLAEILGAKQKQKNFFEGPNYIVTWALGHLLTLKMPEDIDSNWKTWAMETLPMIPKKWEIKPLPKTTGQLKAIGQLAKRGDVTGAIIATDAGREGELVAREILQWVRFNKPVERLWISSQTKKAVETGFKQLQPAKKYDALYESALARSKADWLVGLNVTRALTVKYGDNLSAGRVQTPTLAAVNQVEEKINKFIPQTFYKISLKTDEFSAPLVTDKPQQFLTRESAEAFVAEIQGKIGKVVDISEKETRERPPLPFDLTEIQRVANQQYQFSAKKTLSLVQSLYETHKIVSYPRTDSKYLPQDVKSTMEERLQAVVSLDPRAKKFLKNPQVKLTSVFNDAKVTDHYALIPTEQTPTLLRLSSDELKIYRLIVGRFLGLFADDHREKQTTVTIGFSNGAKFKLKQSIVLEAGFKENTPVEKSGPHFTKETTVKGQFIIEKSLTKAPKLETEAGLLGYMEKNALGTPATRAEIIEKLIKSELMARSASAALTVTPKGKQLLKLVNPSLVTPELTSKWEKQLEKIGQEKLAPQQFIGEIITDTKKLVTEIKDSKADYQDFSITTKVCPECGSLLREKNTRDGKIYVCTNENCQYRRRKDPKVSNHRCPQCHRKMEILDGKNGAYFRCKFDGTTEKIPDKHERRQKISKHEEKKLLKKVNQESEEIESPLALALKAAMKDD
ncbi:DNA topoisomerase 3 [Enterococcus timonensis]|uniref:DNA topoisomerase 3 n=1 Tax=Enterococcus timonensis TaxID=1852364 RepID=UPI0008DA7FB9|nr:DNA topoisomerase 3 [Enterococcus timonensis]